MKIVVGFFLNFRHADAARDVGEHVATLGGAHRPYVGKVHFAQTDFDFSRMCLVASAVIAKRRLKPIGKACFHLIK